MELDPISQIQSVSEFRTKTEGFLKSLSKHKTILLTNHGKTCAVLIDPKAYEEQLDRLRLAEKLLGAHRELEDGGGVPHETVERLTRTWV